MKRRRDSRNNRMYGKSNLTARIIAVFIAILLLLTSFISIPGKVSADEFAEDQITDTFMQEEQVTEDYSEEAVEEAYIPENDSDYVEPEYYEEPASYEEEVYEDFDEGEDISYDEESYEDGSYGETEEVQTEEEITQAEDPSPSLLTLDELYELKEDSVDATIQSCDESTAIRDERKWTANIFYLNQEDAHHVEKTENFNLKYEIEFRSADFFDPFSVEIRIPLGPVKYGTSEKDAAYVAPSDIAVPKGSYDKTEKEYKYTESEKTDFNYYIDEDKDEIVFFNYTTIAPSTVNAWQVLYKDIDVTKTLPDTKWSFVPEINVKKGEITEHLEKDELTPVTGVIAEKKDDQSVDSKAGDEQGNLESSPQTLEDLAKLPEKQVGALVLKKAPPAPLKMVDSESGDLHFDIYYMNQQDPHFVYKTDDFTLKYQMEFHNDIDIAPFDVQIRIPVSAVLYGHGEEKREQVLPTDMGIPEGSYDKETGEYTWKETRKSDFNYYVDEETNEFVFFNYKAVPAASDNAWQVLYKDYDVMEIEDEFQWSLLPSVTVYTTRGVEDPETGETTIQKVEETISGITPLTGRVNTGVQLQTVTKTPYKQPGKQYTPGLYTKKQVLTYAPNGADVLIPGTAEKLFDHFDDYVYVVWETRVKGYATQPYNLNIVDTLTQSNISNPSAGFPNGFIVGFKEVGGTTKENLDQGQPDNVGVYNAEEYSKQRILDRSYTVVSAYPRETVTVNQTVLRNNVNYSMQPYDQKDYTQNYSADANWTYVDYDWHYHGDIIGVTKSGTPQNLNSWITTYELIDQEEDLPTANFSVKGTCRSFALTHELSKTKLGNYIPGKYAKVTTVDDAVYAFPLSGTDTAGTPYKLGKDDYYYNSVTVRIADKGYDVYEDELSSTVPVSETTFTDPEFTIDRNLHVYAMFALDEDGNLTEEDDWEKVGVAAWDESGNVSYTFTPEQIAREPWRVKMVHNTVDYVTESYIDLNISIKGDSPTFRSFPSDVEIIRLENICGIMGEEYDYETSRGYFQDQTVEGKYSEEHNPGLISQTQELYETILMRDNAFTNLLRESLHAHASKTGDAFNDRENSRAKVRYRMEASEGYQVFSPIAIQYIERAGEPTPHRSEIVFYDLLPFGVQFDPSGTVVAGRLTSPSTRDGIVSAENTWDKTQIEVDVDPQTDIILNYHDTGRTMVAFHIYYTGRDSTKYAAGEWFSGFGLAFDAYCDYEDYSSATERPNIVAYMPGNDDQKPIFGTDAEVSYDDGHVVSSDGMSYYYEEMGADINGDGNTNTHNVLYAQSQVFSDIAIASQASLVKLVRAEDDPFGVYKESTTVLPGNNYEYKISLMNTSPISLKNIVFFDRIENAIEDRWEQEPGKFDETDWKGTFKGVNVAELRSAGITPVVYYNESRDAILPTGDQNPYEILTTDNGWILAENWDSDISNVHAVAVDISAHGFILEPDDSVSFLIQMKAPSEMPPEGTTWAYNNAAFYSVQQEAEATVIGNSIKVKLVEAKKLELEKQFADGVPAQRQNDSFKFTLTWSDGKTAYPYSYKTYSLMEKYMNPDTEKEEWVRQNGLYATDASGSLNLKAGQKAVFEDLDAENIQIKEEDSLRWVLEDPTLEGTITNGVRTVEAVNNYRPILYVQKNVSGYSAGDKSSVNLDEFRLQLTDKDNQPIANKEIYVVSRAMTNGDEPTIINGTYKLYGNLEKPAVIPEGERTLRTDENGWFTIYAQETIAIPMNCAGDTYKIVEDPTCYAPETDWIGQKPEDNAALDENGTLLSIKNQFRWKQVLITKTVDHAGSNDLSEEEFTFKIYHAENGVKGEQITDFTWQLVDSENAISEAWNDPGEDGEITAACANKYIRVSRFKAGTELIIEEVLSEDQVGKYEAKTGSVDLVVPVYASVARATFVNEYLYRDLKITKTAVTADQSVDLTQVPFTMYLETASEESSVFVPVTGKEYKIYNSETNEQIKREDGEAWVTGEDGSFTVFGNTYAYFTNLDKVNYQWRARELVDATYAPLFPEKDEDATIEFPDPNDETKIIKIEFTEYLNGILADDENKVEFVNGNDGILILKKKWVGDDPMSQQYIESKNNWYSSFRIETDGFDNTWDQPFSVLTGYGINYSGTSRYYDGPKTIHYYYVDLYGKDAYVILQANPYYKGKEGFEFGSLNYTITEQAPSGSMERIYDSGPYNGRIYCINPGESEKIEIGTPSERPVVEFENHLSIFESIVQKRVVGENVPAGKTLTWRVERFTNGEWEPAVGIPYFITSRSRVWNRYSSNNLPTPLESEKNVTGTDGLIRMTLENTFLASCWYSYYQNGSYYYNAAASDMAVMFYDKVYVNLKEGKEGDLRVVEVPGESDEEWGDLAAYLTSDWDLYNFYWYYSSSPAPDPSIATGFINTNRKQKLKVEKKVDSPDDTVFHFLLEYYKDRFDGDDLALGANIPYAVYDAESEEILYHSVTNSKGNFTLLGGQYALFEVTPNKIWKVTEEQVLPYYVKAIEVDGELIENPGNSGEVNQIPYYDQIKESNMLSIYLSSSLSRLMQKVSTSETYYFDNNGHPLIRNIYFGKPSDYPAVISDTYEVLDSYLTGSIRGYAVKQEDEDESGNTFKYCDVYILSDNLMYTNTDSSGMFGGLQKLENVYFSNIDSSKTRNMNGLFADCYVLKNLNGLSQLNTENVTAMGYMFSNCQSITDLDISSFATANVTYMRSMFSNCYKLKNLNGLSKLNTENVTDMSSMFSNCQSITDLDVSRFNTGNVEQMNSMFLYCEQLNSLNLSSFDTSKVYDMYQMFYGCEKLTDLNVSKLNTGNVTNMSSMFAYCSQLVNLDLTSFDTSKVNNMGSMFRSCKNLQHIYVSKQWSTSNVNYSFGMFTEDSLLPNFNSGYTDKTNAYVGPPSGYLEYK